MTWRLIFRNIVRNRKNSAVIFFLIALITALFFTGNSVMGQTDTGLRRTYVDSLTADVIIQKNSGMSMNLFGANSPVIDNYVSIPTLPAYDHIVELVSAEEGVAGFTGQVSGKAFLTIPDIDSGGEAVLLCGAESEKYFGCFPGIVIEEGSALVPGEYGAMITAERADRLERETGVRPAPGMAVLLMAGGTAGFKIREVPLTGIYRYRNPGQFMNEIVIADPQTVRVLEAIQVATGAVETGGTPESAVPGNIDDIFGGTETIEDYADEGFSPEDLGAFLSSFGEAGAETSGGDWNFILIRLKEGVSPAAFIRDLNKKLAPFDVYASGWRTAAGISAIMMLLVQTFFNIGGFLVSVAGVIVTVNILLISVFRRTREIGTLRAIGASGSWIRRLVLGENCFLSCLAGIAGVALGAGFLAAVNSMNIEIANDLVASLLGAKILRIGFLPLTALASFGIAVVLGAAASVYPVETAVRIDPVTAVREG